MSNSISSPPGSYTRVALGYNRFALIDTDDAALVVQYRWHAIPKHNDKTKHYASTTVSIGGVKSFIYLHRLLMQPPDGMDVDHRDGDSLNCRRENMRICTEQQNVFNRKKRRDSKTLYLGVFQPADVKRRWYAKLTHNGKVIHLGSFSTPEDAARAYDAKAKELRGEFAYLNFPEEEVA